MVGRIGGCSPVDDGCADDNDERQWKGQGRGHCWFQILCGGFVSPM